MADVSDVWNALASFISGILYPNGTGQPSALSYNGSPLAFRVYPGWPVTEDLNADLAAGVVNVNVYALPAERVESVLPGPAQITSAPAPTLTLTAMQISGGYTATVGGSVTAGNVVSLNVNGTGYAYAAKSTDTLDSVASALSALIPGSSVSGSIITIPGAWQAVARVAAPQTAISGVKQQSKPFQIVTWASSPIVRDQVAAFVDSALGGTYRLTLADGSMCVLAYERTVIDDLLQKENAWRRDLFYRATYMTTQSQTYTPVTNVVPTTALTPA